VIYTKTLSVSVNFAKKQILVSVIVFCGKKPVFNQTKSVVLG